MNSAVFEEVLREIDNRFRAQDKKILLLIDNALSHFDPNYWTNQDEVISDEDDDPATSGK